LSKTDRAVSLILTKHVQGVRITAYYLFILGAIFLAVGIYGYILYPRMRVVHPMAAACGIALIAFGVSFHRLARKG
jgi:sulfite exporter TauE/SafE